MRVGILWRAASALGLALALAPACGDSEEPRPAAGAGDASSDAGSDGGTDAAPDALPLPPGAPEPLPVAAWMVTSVANANSDPVYAALEDKSFALPPAGTYLGLTWTAVTPGENGELIGFNADLIYAAAKVSVPPGRRVIARGDTVATFFVDAQHRQPGDFYHSKKLRVPLAVRGSEALVVVRALGRRKVPEVELWSTTAELFVNAADPTLPDLVAGSSAKSFVGVAVLNLSEQPVANVSAQVLESADFAPSAISYPSLAGSSVTQLSFELSPKAPPAASGQVLDARLRIEAPSLAWPYEVVLPIPVVAAGDRRRHTRRSKVDGSTQYYSVLSPSQAAPPAGAGLVLSLHGASVEASGQAAAYSPKTWAYVVAPTNRRPFGFDWEEWGRLDALEALEDAMSLLPIDPLRVHLTGHSMGGHGSWHAGVHFSDRFAVVGPSAGWISFEKYGGPLHPPGVLGRARAASQTLDFVGNLSNNAVYIIHGAKDDNVPVAHAQEMYATLGPIVADLTYFEEPNSNHWWDLDAQEEGADCVDWNPMFALMEQKKRDPVTLDFDFTTPSPWVSSERSFVRVLSALSPMANVVVHSVSSAGQVNLTTQNVRSMLLDGAALSTKGVTSVSVDGTPYAVSGAPIAIGPSTGKRPDLHGPLNQVFQRPFCFVWEDAGPVAYRDWVSLLVSWWSLIGNGQACGLPRSALTNEIEAEYNLIFVGVAAADAAPGTTLPIAWSASSITIGSSSTSDAALAFVYPVGKRLRGFVTATAGSEHLLFRYVPFTSRSGRPDFWLWSTTGTVASGFFDAEWKLDPASAEGL